MNKKFKKIMVLVSSLVFVIALAFVFLPELTLIPKEETNTNKNNFSFNTELNGQIVYASDDTGASEVDLSKKGGAMFLSEGTNYTMSGGTISGVRKEYGGAFYVSKNATLTINGGTIKNCQAKYGGAIYVESGGTCIINGGNIINNKAEVAPAIYVENGATIGTLEIGGDAEISQNRVGRWLTISLTKKTMGANNKMYSNVELYTIEFGSYPQQVVSGDLANSLENLYANQPSLKEYIVRNNEFSLYRHTDGNLYVRGHTNRLNMDSYYEDNTLVSFENRWFKVEPITWFVLNYDDWKSGKEPLKLYSELVLAGDIPFNLSTNDGNNWKDSFARNWCNNVFFNDAFTDDEKDYINVTSVKNNITNNFMSPSSDGLGATTEDYVYLPSFYDMASGLFSSVTNSPDIANSQPARVAHATDFAVANYAICSATNDEYLINGYRKTHVYWLRSSGELDRYACFVGSTGILYGGTGVDDNSIGIRPAININFKYVE